MKLLTKIKIALIKRFKMEINLNATDLKNILKPIPEDQFITDFFQSDGKRCAMGHIYFKLSGTADPTVGNVLPVKNIVNKIAEEFIGITTVNDGILVKGNIYHQETPKQRVLALLDDAIKIGL